MTWVVTVAIPVVLVVGGIFARSEQPWKTLARVGVALIFIAGCAVLAGWLFTVISPDRSTSATDLYALGVFLAALGGLLVGVVVAVVVWVVVNLRRRRARTR